MSWRAHDPDDSVPTFLGIGSIGVLPGTNEPARDRHVGKLLVPDLEERRGWRAWYVYPEPKPGAERHPLGFRKP